MSTKIATVAKDSCGERVIKISFPYDFATLDKVRSLPGRKYHKEIRCWSAPIYADSISKLTEWGFIINPALQEILNTAQCKYKTLTAKDGIPGLQGNLYPFQREGVAFIEHNKGRALVADEMGLGKTIQALAWLQLHPNLRPAIIVTPASLKLNWQREIDNWMTLKCSVRILSGTTPWPDLNEDIYIINYDILRYWIPTLKKLDPPVLITDECHYYKSNKAERTKAVKMLCKGIPYVIALSGTPIINRPIEARNAIFMIHPTLFKSAWYFTQRFCNAKHNGFGWDFNGASHTGELHETLVKTIMIRRLKKDVLKDLPPKTRSFIPIELSNTKEYISAEKDFIKFVKETRGHEAARRASNAEQLVKIEGLKQVAVKGKMKQAVEWIRDFLEVENKLVVFVTHKSTVTLLQEEFPNISISMVGGMSDKRKQEARDSFQEDPNVRLFIGMLDVEGRPAGVGWTLTASSNVAFLELPWSPGVIDQAGDRCHRIGQKDNVTIYFLLAQNTIEERLAKIIDTKKLIVDAVLDGKMTEQESLLSQLMKSYEISKPKNRKH